jgi:hypothetical protein
MSLSTKYLLIVQAHLCPACSLPPSLSHIYVKHIALDDIVYCSSRLP